MMNVLQMHGLTEWSRKEHVLSNRNTSLIRRLAFFLFLSTSASFYQIILANWEYRKRADEVNLFAVCRSSIAALPRFLNPKTTFLPAHVSSVTNHRFYNSSLPLWSVEYLPSSRYLGWSYLVVLECMLLCTVDEGLLKISRFLSCDSSCLD